MTQGTGRRRRDHLIGEWTVWTEKTPGQIGIGWWRRRPFKMFALRIYCIHWRG